MRVNTDSLRFKISVLALGISAFVLAVYSVLVSASFPFLLHKKGLFFMAVSIPLILSAAWLFIGLFIKRILQPIRGVTHAAEEIDYKDLGQRLETEGVDEEMKGLVEVLNQMMSRLERSFKCIAEFSSHVSHALKTPLAILRSESELALRSDHSQEEHRGMIKSNLEEISSMSKIINDLLLLTKLDFQSEIFHFESFDLKDLLKEIADSARILADPKKIAVTLEIPKTKAIPFYGDKAYLRRLFFNLINNAVKFTRAGGTIGLSAKTDGTQILLGVSDTGVGIPENDLPQVFEKFFHSEEESADTAGNGLGLSIAQSIARIHHGDIQVESSLGKGSTFTVRFPL